MEITAKTDGKSVLIKVQKTERIIDVKKKIQEKIGLTPEEQKLIYQGGILEDDKTVDYYQIAEKSVINVVARLTNGTQLFAQTMDGTIFTFNVQKTERVSDLKKNIQEKIGLAPEQQLLLFQEGILEDDKTVDEYQITQNSTIHVTARMRGDPHACPFIKTLDGTTIQIVCATSEKIFDLKKEIEEQTGMPMDRKELVFREEVLEDDKTVGEYGMRCGDGSVITVVPESRSIKIQIKSSNGKIELICFLKTVKIMDLKKKIQEKIGLAPEEQSLVFLEEILEDDKTVDEYQIEDTSVINVVARLRNGMLIFIKTMDGKTFAKEILKTYRVSDIKKKIQEKIGLAPDEQKLVFRGRILKDDKTVDEYQIAEKSVINIVARRRLSFM